MWESDMSNATMTPQLHAPDAPAWWLDEEIGTAQAAKLCKISIPAMIRRFQNNWCEHFLNGRKYETTRRMIRDAMRKAAAAKHGLAANTRTPSEGDAAALAEAKRQFGDGLELAGAGTK